MKAVVICWLLVNLGSMETGAQPLLQHNQFTLEGWALNLEGEHLYLFYYDNAGNYRKDSFKVNNGAFKFSGKIAEPSAARLTTEGNGASNKANTLHPIFLEPAQLKLIIKKDQFPSSKMQGSKVNDAYWFLEKKKAGIYSKLQAVQDEINQLSGSDTNVSGINDRLARVQNKAEQLRLQIIAIDKKYFEDFPRSYVTAYLLLQYVNVLPVADLNVYYNRMPPIIQRSRFGRDLKAAMENRQ